MFTEIIQPRFSETDALGHINNTVLTVWFEACRTPIFKIFTPELNLQQWPLIVASIQVDFKAQLHYGQEVEIKSWISRIGNSSFDVTQQAWQQGKCCAEGKTALVRFDYQSQQASPLSPELRAALEQHYQS